MQQANLTGPALEGKSIRMLIPAKALAEVARALGDQSDPVAICVSASHGQVLFHLNSIDIVAQLIDHKFIDYEQIIPRSHVVRAVVNTADLLRACRRASIYARDVNDRMQLQLKPSDDVDPGTVAVSAHAEETGDNLSDIEASVSGERIDISFNARYVIDVLAAIDAPQIAIETASARSAAVFKLVGDDSFLHIIMPLNRG